MKTWGPCPRIIKNFEMVTREHYAKHCTPQSVGHRSRVPEASWEIDTFYFTIK